jgi:beta-glucosidase
MAMREIIIAILLLVICFSGQDAVAGEKSDIRMKVDELLSKMTLDEKIGQLNQYTSRWEMTGPAPQGKGEQELLEMIKKGQVGSMLNVTGAIATRNAQELAVENSRLGIPLIFGYDVIHGYRTMFPIPLAVAASWDPSAAELSARIAATETAASGVHWTFAPMVDIARDARWGRIMEGAGEDPYLGAQMAAAQVRGFQGNDLSAENTIAACAKHFAAYGFAEAGRDYNTVEITENTLRNIVLPPFKACADAGVATFMNSFNEIGGITSTANDHLVGEILKGEWGFKGFVVSDWNSVGEIYDHGLASDKKEAAFKAIKAGCDMDMEGNAYIAYLKELIQEGRIDEKLIDDAVRRILTVKFELGLFDDPFRYSDPEKEKILLSKEHLEASREVAQKSIVLLKNENQLLPLRKSGQRIAVIGDLADDKDSPLGSWRAQAITGSAISLLEGMKNALQGQGSLTFEQGPVFIKNTPQFTQHLQFNENDLTGINQAVELAKKSDVVVLALGENCFQTGEGRSQTEIGLKGVQQQLLEAVYAANKNIVVVLMNGRPLVIDWMAKHVPAIIEAWHLGSEAGNAVADVLFGDYNPSGKLPVSFPRSVGQCPIYYNHKNTGRPVDTGAVFWSHYTDQSNEPLFPFGYGLSYTTFEYSDLKLSSSEIRSGEKLKVSVNLKNTGKYEGAEVVQLYIRDLYGSVTRPVKELKGFKKISLKPGENRIVEFELSSEDLAFYTADGEWKAEPGNFHLWIGTNSQEGLKGEFALKK